MKLTNRIILRACVGLAVGAALALPAGGTGLQAPLTQQVSGSAWLGQQVADEVAAVMSDLYPDHDLVRATSTDDSLVDVTLTGDGGDHVVTATVFAPPDDSPKALSELDEHGEGREDGNGAVVREDEVATSVARRVGDGRVVMIIEQTIRTSDKHGRVHPHGPIQRTAAKVAKAVRKDG